MKKAKHLQRFWAFLLAFVLVSTTIASDGMSIVAAEGETTTEQTVSDPKTAEQTSNKGGSAFTAETEQQGETPQVEEGSKTGGNTSGGSSESSTEESVVESESSTETGTSGESVSTEDIVTTEEGTEETSTEVTTEVTTETETETFTETEGAKAETFTFTFDISGKGSVTDEEGNNVGSTVTGETGSVYKFNVEAEGTDVSILVDGNEIGTSNGSYEVAFDADKKITVTFAETESEVKEEKYTITFQITGNGKVTDTEGTEINSLTGKINEELRFKVEAENADSKVTVKMDDKELTAADGVYTVQGKSDTAVNVNIEEPEKEEIAYTLYVEHFLDTNRGRYHRVDAPVELTEADFKDGKIDVSKYEFKRTGMVLVSAETLTKEDFDKDGKGYAEIHYKVADGWKIVDNRPSYRTIYLGNLDEDNPDIVPEGDYFTLKVKFSFEDGSSVANDFTAKYLIDEDSSKNTYTISVPKQEGYYPTISDTDVTLSADGTSLNGSYSEKGSREITVVYKVKQLQYTVKHAFEKADGTEYTVDDSLTETFSGDYGELTEAKAVAVDGFTPEEIANEVLTQDGIVITIKYDRNTYWLTYDANGGTYVARESGKYEQVMTVKGNDATTRVGYTFDGWYLDKEFTKEVGRTIELKEDTVLYAKWEAKKVGYSIVYLAEDVNGAEGNHDRYIKTVYIEATNRRNTTKAGDKIVIPDWYLQNSSLGEEHYHQAGYNTNVIAKADGTSEVRVYYDLNVYNFIFNVATKYSPSWNSSYTVAGKITFGKDTYTGSQYRFQAKYGQNVSSVWPAAQSVTGTYSNNKKCYFATWGDSIATKRLIIGDAEVPDEHVDGASRTFKATWTGQDTMVVGHYFFEKVDGSGYVEDPVYKSTVYADGLSQKEIEGYIKADEYKDPEYKNGAWNYYFKYKRQSYKLYFYNDSTSPVRQETLKYGYPLTNYNYTPNAPTGKNDYTFGGWYDNSACEGARIDLTNMTMPKANLALYAKWIAPEYDVNFISEGKTLHTDKVEKGNTVNPYTDPVRNGYSFIGWYESTSPDAKLFDFAKPITKNTNIYAHWKANTETTYIVRYLDKNTGNPVYPETAPISGKVGSNVVAKAINVDGYFVDAKSKSIVLSAEAENNVIVFNYYKIGSVEFQYVTKYVDDNNNVINSSGNLTTKDNILTVAADAKKAPGYIITPTRITKNMAVGEVTEFVFNCTAKSYNITYVNVEGTTWNGAGTNPNPSTYKTTDADITLVNPSKPYFEFTGWTCSVEDTDGEPHDPMHTVISTGSYGDLVFTATWEEVFPTETITITAASDEKMYDGTPLTNNGYTYTQGILHPGDKLTAVVVGSQTDADKTGVNEVESYKVTRTTSDGTIDVTSKYNITTAPGELKVNKRSVIFTSGDGYKVYDGTALTNSNVVISGDGFADGEGVSFNVTGSQLVAGESENTFAYTLNEGTKAVNYDIHIQLGKLVVDPVSGEFKVVAGTSSRMYDGTPFSYNVYNLVEGTLVSGDKLVVTIEGQLTDVGDTENKITSVKVMNGTVDVTASYPKISTINGKLTVTPRTVILTSGSAEKEYDGTPLTNATVTVSGSGFAAGEGAVYDVTGSQTEAGSSANAFTYQLNDGTKKDNYNITKAEGTLNVTKRLATITVTAGNDSKKYDGTELRSNTYSSTGKLADGETLLVMVEGSITNVGSTENKVASVKVMRGEKEVTSNYENIVKVSGTLTVTKRNVILTSATDSKAYDGTPLTNSNITVGGDGFAEGEGAAYDVTGSQTVAGTSDNTFTYTLNKGTLEGNYDITKAVGKLTVTASENVIIVTAASADKTYDGTPLTDAGYAYTGELAGDDKVVATVEGSITDAGTQENKVTQVRIMRGTEEVTDSYSHIDKVSGTLTVTKRNVILRSADDSKAYDGTPLTNSNVTAGGDGFAAGEGASYDVTGSQTEAGSSPNTFSYVLNEGTKENNYNIIKNDGTLTVTPNLTEIRIKASDADKMYDGTPLSRNAYSRIGELVEGDTLEVMVAGSITDAGSTDNIVTGVKVMRGSEDVTSSYGNIVFEKGTLTVTKREVILTSASDSKAYDGTALTNSMVTVSGDGFAEGEGASYNVTGSQTEAGKSDNTFTYKLNKGTKEGNYVIVPKEGVLEVTRNMTEISVTAGSAKEKYNGAPLLSNTYFSTGTLADGDSLVVMVEGQITDVGTVKNTVTSVKVMRGSKDVTDSYGNIITANGKLEVTKREVILTSASDSKEYDGTPLTNDLVTVSGDDFVKGEGAAYDVTGSQTFAGTSENTFTYALKDNTKADNYEVTTVFGNLEVTNNEAEKRIITITAASDTKPYDGTALTKASADVEDQLLADTDTLLFTVEGSQTIVGSSANKVQNVSIMNGTEDVTDYYTVITADGTLKVTGSITYNENGGSGNVPEDSNQYDYDADITLMGAGELYRDNAVFLGWSEAPTALVESQEAEAAANILGSTIRMGETNITVYAVWAIDENGPDGGPDDTPDYKEYPITYYGNGGSGSVTDTNIYPVDYDVTLLANGFSKDGNHFTGWGIDAQGSAVYQPGNTLSMVEGGLSVYAQWAANSAPTPENPDPNPNPNPTPDTTPSTTGVLGEALPPAQPEVGVLGEAAGPEVGVLGESKGPGTGDTAPIAGWSFLIMGAVLTLGITAKRRKKDEK